MVKNVIEAQMMIKKIYILFSLTITIAIKAVDAAQLTSIGCIGLRCPGSAGLNRVHRMVDHIKPGLFFAGLYDGTAIAVHTLADGDGKKGIPALHKLIIGGDKPIQIAALNKRISSSVDSDIQNIHNAYKIMDANLTFFGKGQHATLVTVLIKKASNKKEVTAYLTSLGLPSAILITENGTITHRTNNHTLANSIEEARFMHDCGQKYYSLINPKQKHTLYTRAIGKKKEFSSDGKQKKIIATPETLTIRLTPRHMALVLASDTFWSMFDESKMAQLIIQQRTTPNIIFEQLQQLAQQSTSSISMGASIILFNWK